VETKIQNVQVMDSLSKMLNRLRPNNPLFKEQLISITSVYCDAFDSDTVMRHLAEGTLREEKNGDGIAYIPCIEYSKDLNDYIYPTEIIIGDDIVIPFPQDIEEFRSMCLAHGIKVRLNNHTAQKLFR